jgi:hypothetical protein
MRLTVNQVSRGTVVRIHPHPPVTVVAKGTGNEQRTETTHRDNPQSVGSRQVKIALVEAHQAHPGIAGHWKRSLTIREGCRSAGGGCADVRDNCDVRCRAWGLAGEVTRASVASVVVCGHSSVGRTRPCQGRGDRFETDCPLQQASAFRSRSGTSGSNAHGTKSDAGYHRRFVDSDCRRLPLRGAGRRVLTCWKYADVAHW